MPQITYLGCHASEESVSNLRQYTNLFQIFFHSPLKFELDYHKMVENVLKVKQACPDACLVAHGPYNTNIMIENRLLKLSLASIASHLKAALSLGIENVVIHPGTRHFKSKTEDKEIGVEESMGHMVKVLRGLMNNFKGKPVRLLLENMASTGAKGMPINALLSIIEQLRDREGLSVGLCLDTEHYYAHGEPLDKLEHYMALADVVHFNTIPAEVAWGSGLDRHSVTSINESTKEFSPDVLRERLLRFPETIKILEMYPDTAERSFKELLEQKETATV